jgi:hypothetical protein
MFKLLLLTILGVSIPYPFEWDTCCSVFPFRVLEGNLFGALDTGHIFLGFHMIIMGFNNLGYKSLSVCYCSYLFIVFHGIFI